MTEHAILPLGIQLTALAVLLAFLAWVVRLIRSQRLSVRDSLAWLVTTGLALLVTAFPSLLVAAAHLVGVQIPSNAVFGVGLLYLAVNVLTVTITTSGNAERTRRLAQECALLRAEVDRLRAERAGPAGPAGGPPAPPP